MKVLRDGTVYLAANLVSAAVPFLLLPLLTRVMPPSEYGRVVNYFLLVSACSALAGLNVHGAVGVAWFRRDRAELPDFVGTALWVAAISTCASAGLVAAILVGTDVPGLSPTWGALAAIAAGCNVVLQCLLVLWQNERRPLPVAGLQILASVCNVGFSLLGVLWLQLQAGGRNGGALVASLLMAVLAVLLLVLSGKARPSFRKSHVPALLAFGIPLIPHAAAGVLLASADRFIVSVAIGPAELGVYGAGAQLGAIMAMLSDSFSKAFGPWLYERLSLKESREELRAIGAIYLSAPVLLVLAAGLGAVLIPAGALLLGPAYAGALRLLPWFVAGGAFMGMYLAVANLYFFHGRTGLLSSVTVPASLLGAAGTLWLVHRHGVDGAAAGFAVTQALLAAGAWLVAGASFTLPWRHPAAAWAALRQGTIAVPRLGGQP